MKKVLALLALLGSVGCSHIIGVADLSASPDGNTVVVVGKQLDRLGSMIYGQKPIYWVCTRSGGNGPLNCVPDTTPLPGGSMMTAPQ